MSLLDTTEDYRWCDHRATWHEARVGAAVVAVALVILFAL